MDENVEWVPIKDLKTEEGAKELLDSELMKPYLRAAASFMANEDMAAAIAEIAELPLEQRYVWRIASALKWAFADFDDLSVQVDRQTLSPEDSERVLDLLKLRPIQFCMFLKALVGAEKMQRMMVEAIKVSRQIP
jgi:hypothetical protein